MYYFFQKMDVTWGVGGEISNWMPPFSATGGGSGFGGKTRHTRPFP